MRPLRQEPNRGQANARRGMTLVELMVASAVLVILLLGMTRTGAGVTKLFATSVTRMEVEQQLRQSMGRLTTDLRHASLGSFDAMGEAPLWTNATGFDRINGLDPVDGEGIWRSMRLELRMGEGETDDGLDEDGDGLVDERQLVLTRDVGTADAREQVMLRDIPELFPGEVENGLDDNGNGLLDETGFAIYTEDGALKILLSKIGIDEDRRLITRSLSTSAKLRN
jgi:prepilin-type N-terminal cleavage/methylation domain-containing protein